MRAMASPITGQTERITVDYARVSEDDRGAAEGVESQHSDSEGFAEEIGRPLAATYQDNDISAFTGRERPEYQRLLTDMGRGLIAAVVVWHADRLSRNVREALDFIDLAVTHDVRLFSVQKGGEYLLTRSSGRSDLIDDINRAQRESGHKGERITLARKRQARTGAFGGGIRPYGWGVPTGRVRSVCVNPKAPLDQRTYVDQPVMDMSRHCPDEADEIRLWAEELLATRGNMAQLLRNINKRGVPTVSQKDGRSLRYRGKAVEHGGWESRTVRQILLSPRVSGHTVHRGQIVRENAFTPIIPEETRQALITLLEDPARRTVSGTAPKWLVSVHGRCGYCGDGYVTARRNRKGPVYRCQTCHRGNQLAELVDEYIAGVAVERLSRDDLADLIRPVRPEVDIVALRGQITELQRRKREAAKSYARGAIDLETLETVKADISQQTAGLRGSLAEATAASPLADFLETDTVAAAFKAWEARSIGRRREIVRLLMDITLLKGATHHLDPATVLITPKGRRVPDAVEERPRGQ